MKKNREIEVKCSVKVECKVLVALQGDEDHDLGHGSKESVV